MPLEILEASHGGVGSVMKQGDKIRISKIIRSNQTGLLLPREGIFLGAIENIGRTLLLVDFENQERNTFSTTRSRHRGKINKNRGKERTLLGLEHHNLSANHPSGKMIYWLTMGIWIFSLELLIVVLLFGIYIL